MDNRFVENSNRKSEYLETQQLNVCERRHMNEAAEIRDSLGDLKNLNWLFALSDSDVFD